MLLTKAEFHFSEGIPLLVISHIDVKIADRKKLLTVHGRNRWLIEGRPCHSTQSRQPW
jgi:hypothetical protein